MKIILITLIFFQMQSYAKKELILQDWRPEGRWGFQCLDSNDCYAINSNNKVDVYNSIDKGKTWTLIKTIIKENLDPPVSDPWIRWCYVLDSNSFYFLDRWDGGSIFYTNDRFQTIKSKRICEFGVETDFYMIDTMNGMVVQQGRFIKTYDNWETCEYFSVWNDEDFRGIAVFDNVFPKNDSVIYLTASIFDTLGVNDWTNSVIEYNFFTNEINVLGFLEYEIQGNESNPQSKDLLFINEKVGFVIANNERESGHNYTDYIYKTTDGGYSWKLVLENFECCFSFKDIAFRDEHYGIAVEANKYYETFDGGETWHYGFFERPENESLHILCFVEFAGDRCIIASYDKGIYAWEEVPTKSVEASESNIIVWNGGSSLRIGSDQNNLEIIIFDLIGNKIHSEIFNKNTVIDLSNFTSSSYVFHILKDGKIIRSGKFLTQ